MKGANRQYSKKDQNQGADCKSAAGGSFDAQKLDLQVIDGVFHRRTSQQKKRVALPAAAYCLGCFRKQGTVLAAICSSSSNGLERALTTFSGTFKRKPTLRSKALKYFSKDLRRLFWEKVKRKVKKRNRRIAVAGRAGRCHLEAAPKRCE